MKKNLLACILISILTLASCSNESENKSISKLDSTENKITYAEFDTSYVLKEFDPKQILPYKKWGRWGYKNNNDEFVIRTAFDGCGFFSDGYAWVKKGKNYKIINDQGNYISDSANFERVGQASSGIIPTKKDKLWGAIDTLANVIIEYNYNQLEVLDSNLLLINKDGRWGLIDRSGKDIALPVYRQRIRFKDGLAKVTRNYRNVGIINKAGKEIVKCEYDDVKIVNDSTFIVAKDAKFSKYIYGLIVNEKLKYPVEFSRINIFQDSLLAMTKMYKAGILNVTGDTIIHFNYNDIIAGNTNLLAVKGDEKWGYINFEEDTLIDFQYDYAEAFKGEVAIVYQGNTDRYNSKPDRSALINYKGEIILPFESRKLKFLYKNILMRSKYNYDINLYDLDGNSLDSLKFDSQQFNSPEDPVSGYIEDEIKFYEFVNGFAIVGHKGNVGMINEEGEIVIPLKYHHLEPMNEYGYAKAQYLDKYGIVDSKGNEIVPVGYNHIGYDEQSGLFFLQKYDENREYKDRFVNEGYWNYSGELLSDTPLKAPEPYNVEEQISKIREEYNQIQSESEEKDFSTISLPKEKLIVEKSYNKIIVEDTARNIRYEYYYNSNLNKYGPFFIFKVEGEEENRYYFHHGRIIRWLDKNKKERLISDAIYAPEHDEHFKARKFKALAENKILIEEHNLDIVKNRIDSLCQVIETNINAGIYKKGDTERASSGEYTSLNETYIDSLQNVMYKIDAASDETGSVTTEEFYFGENLIRKYSNSNFYNNSNNIPDAQWVSGQYKVTKYYNEGNLVFSEKEENNITTIKKH